MSFLAGRLAATEGAYFLHESKNVVSRHAQKLPPTPLPSLPVAAEARSKIADVLPEILRHDVPLKGISTADASSLSASSKWLVRGSSSSSSSSMVSPDSLNPLRAYVSLPQATFGPKRWQLSNEHPNISASTANDLRRDRFPRPADPEKIKAALAAYAQIGKAFAAATSIVFGGATFLFVYVAYKLELHTTDDIRIKVRELIQPGAETLMEQMGPFRAWVANTSRKWHHESDGGAKEKTIVKELSKTFRARTPN